MSRALAEFVLHCYWCCRMEFWLWRLRRAERKPHYHDVSRRVFEELKRFKRLKGIE